MNTTNVVSALQENFNTVEIVYRGSNQNTYTFKTDIPLEVDDLVVVPSVKEHDCDVAIVTKVHATPQIDFNVNYIYKWVMCKIDMEQYNARMEKEESLQQELMRLEFTKAKESVTSMLKEQMNLTDDEFKMLAGKVS